MYIQVTQVLHLFITVDGIFALNMILVEATSFIIFIQNLITVAYHVVYNNLYYAYETLRLMFNIHQATHWVHYAFIHVYCQAEAVTDPPC